MSNNDVENHFFLLPIKLGLWTNTAFKKSDIYSGGVELFNFVIWYVNTNS